jgi:hypothetical protein
MCAACVLYADDVEVTGIVRAQWRPLFPGARCDGTLTLHACHMRTINSLHRAVAPPPEGLAEQFRCDRLCQGLAVNTHCSDWDNLYVEGRTHNRGLPGTVCSAQQLPKDNISCCVHVTRTAGDCDVPAGTSGSFTRHARSRAAIRFWQAFALR